MHPAMAAIIREAGYDWSEAAFNEIMDVLRCKIQELKDRAADDQQEYTYNMLSHLEAWLTNGEKMPDQFVRPPEELIYVFVGREDDI